MKKNFLTNLSNTFLSQVISAALLVILLRVAATTLPIEEFGLFIVIRRLIAIGFPIVSLKLGISLSRYGYERTTQYLKKSIFILLIIHLILLLSTILFVDQLSKVIFGSSGFNDLVYLIVIYIFSYSLHSLLHGYFRGRMDFKSMNSIVIAFNSIAFVGVVFIISERTIFNYYLFISIANILLCIYYYLKYIHHKTYKKKYSDLNPKNIKVFLMYGVSRLPSGFFFSGLLFLPVYTATHWISIETAGLVGLIIAVISLVQIVTMPVGTLFLPIFAHLQNDNKKNKLKKKIQDIMDFIFSVPLITGFLLFLFSNEIVYIWFGPAFSNISSEISILSIGIGFIIIFILLRSVIDGLSNIPYVNIITFIGLMFFSIGILIIGENNITIRHLTVLFTLSISILGITSIIILRLISSVNILTFRNIISLLWVLINFIGIYFLKNILPIDFQFNILLVKLVITSVIILLTYYLYYHLGYNWIIYIEGKLSK